MNTLRLTDAQIDVITDALVCYATDCDKIDDTLTANESDDVLREIVQQVNAPATTTQGTKS